MPPFRRKKPPALCAIVLPALALMATGWVSPSHQSTRSWFLACHSSQSAAADIGPHFRDLENLLDQLSLAVSTGPGDVDANDALLRMVKSERSDSIGNIFLLSRDGRSIGDAMGQHASAGDRDYFQRVLGGDPLVIGEPIRSRSNVGWVVPIARPIKNSSDEVDAVLVIAIYVGVFNKWLEASAAPLTASDPLCFEQ